MSRGKKMMVGVLAALMLAGVAGGGTVDAYNSVWQCRYCGRQVTKGGSNPPSQATCESNPNINSYGWHGNHVYERIR